MFCKRGLFFLSLILITPSLLSSAICLLQGPILSKATSHSLISKFNHNWQNFSLFLAAMIPQFFFWFVCLFYFVWFYLVVYCCFVFCISWLLNSLCGLSMMIYFMVSSSGCSLHLAAPVDLSKAPLCLILHSLLQFQNFNSYLFVNDYKSL